MIIISSWINFNNIDAFTLWMIDEFVYNPKPENIIQNSAKFKLIINVPSH